MRCKPGKSGGPIRNVVFLVRALRSFQMLHAIVHDIHAIKYEIVRVRFIILSDALLQQGSGHPCHPTSRPSRHAACSRDLDACRRDPASDSAASLRRRGHSTDPVCIKSGLLRGLDYSYVRNSECMSIAGTSASINVMCLRTQI